MNETCQASLRTALLKGELFCTGKGFRSPAADEEATPPLENFQDEDSFYSVELGVFAVGQG